MVGNQYAIVANGINDVPNVHCKNLRAVNLSLFYSTAMNTQRAGYLSVDSLKLVDQGCPARSVFQASLFLSI